MEIVIKMTEAELGQAMKSGGMTVVHAEPKKRGRPTKEEAAARAAAEDDGEADDVDDEEAAPKKKPAKKAALKKKAAEEDEADEEADEEADADDDSDDSEEDDGETDDVDDEAVVSGADLKKVKAALTAFSKAKGSKEAAVKVLRKFATSSEKVKTSDLPKLLKALKV